MSFLEMEFTYAQSPYTMKGMLFGFMQFSRGIGSYFLALLLLVISKGSDCTRGDITDLIEGVNCTRVENPTCLYYTIGHSPNSIYFWFINFFIALIGLPLFIFASFQYSQRRRDYTD